MARWVSCIIKNKFNISGIFSQKFKPGYSNERPTTTASIIYKSFLQGGGVNPSSLCYLYFDKADDTNGNNENYKGIISALSGFSKNDAVVIVWDHGDLPNLCNSIVSLFRSGGCYR